MVVERMVVPAAPERVWRAIVDGTGRAGWWSYLQLDASPGGRMEERWTDAGGAEVVTSGEVVEAVAPRTLRLTWADEGWPAATDVDIALAPCPGGTVVTVRHTGWDRLPGGDALAADHATGWRAHLDDLRRLFDSPPPR